MIFFPGIKQDTNLEDTLLGGHFEYITCTILIPIHIYRFGFTNTEKMLIRVLPTTTGFGEVPSESALVKALKEEPFAQEYVDIINIMVDVLNSLEDPEDIHYLTTVIHSYVRAQTGKLDAGMSLGENLTTLDVHSRTASCLLNAGYVLPYVYSLQELRVKNLHNWVVFRDSDPENYVPDDNPIPDVGMGKPSQKTSFRGAPYIDRHTPGSGFIMDDKQDEEESSSAVQKRGSSDDEDDEGDDDET